MSGYVDKVEMHLVCCLLAMSYILGWVSSLKGVGEPFSNLLCMYRSHQTHKPNILSSSMRQSNFLSVPLSGSKTSRRSNRNC